MLISPNCCCCFEFWSLNVELNCTNENKIVKFYHSIQVKRKRTMKMLIVKSWYAYLHGIYMIDYAPIDAFKKTVSYASYIIIYTTLVVTNATTWVHWHLKISLIAHRHCSYQIPKYKTNFLFITLFRSLIQHQKPKLLIVHHHHYYYLLFICCYWLASIDFLLFSRMAAKFSEPKLKITFC